MSEYEITSEYITITLKALNNQQLDEPLNEPLGVLEVQIRNMLLKNPKITLKEISLLSNFSISTVKRTMNKLISKEIIIRFEGKRFGRWIVKK